MAAGDWNRDGDDDLFITHWIAQENALYDSVLQDLPGLVTTPAGSAAPSGPGSVGLRFSDQAALVGLGQIALRFIGWGTESLLRGDEELAAQRLEWACRTNPRAVGGFFLRAYLAWKREDGDEVRKLLLTAVEARGQEWKPEGAVAEGDVGRRMHREATPLARFWKGWDGGVEATGPLESLDSFLRNPLPGRPVAPIADCDDPGTALAWPWRQSASVRHFGTMRGLTRN